jgi:hypothetical protein
MMGDEHGGAVGPGPDRLGRLISFRYLKGRDVMTNSRSRAGSSAYSALQQKRSINGGHQIMTALMC